MAATQTIRLSQLALRLKDAIRAGFEDMQFRVVAEVTNYSFYSSKGHHYFDLVEKSINGSDILAKMQTAAWSTGNQAIRNFEKTTGQKFKNDIQVLATVSVEYHPVYGLKLILHDIDINYTIGALEKQKQETIQALIAEGFISKIGEEYLTSNNRLTLPVIIQRIAVISSAASAGLQDFIHTMENNSLDYRFFIANYHTVVQGEANAQLVYDKFVEVFTSGILYDAVVIIRGGGSQTDFLLFDQLILGKMVSKFPIPVITGIGHQKNETIVDLVAHTATKTPTKAAEFIISHNRNFEDRLLFIEKNMIIKAQQLLSQFNSDLSTFRLRLSSKPKILVSSKVNELSFLKSVLKNNAAGYFKNQRIHLKHITSLLNTLSPQNILKKGFAIVKKNGTVIGNPENISVGDDISLIFANQEIKSTVTSKEEYDGNEFNV